MINSKLNAKQRRALIRIVAGILLVLCASFLVPESNLKIAIYLIAYLIAGYPILIKAIRHLFHGKLFDENFLMTVATVGAILIRQFPEAVMVILLYEIGEFFQDKAIESSQASVTDLLDKRPSETLRIRNGHEEKILSEKVKVGDLLVIKPGDQVPVDGRIIDGEADVDTAVLTGESVPRHLQINDQLLSGMIVQDGVLKVKVTHVYNDSTVAKILDLVENAANRKTKTENFITKFSRVYTPVVVFGALLLAIVPPLILHTEFRPWISRALIFLVISCPCALVISVPLSYFSGIGAASKIGALIKGSNYLEALTKVDGAIFDKTGTLTKGKFTVTQVHAVTGFSEEKVLRIAALVEQHSPHPIAQAIVKSYPEQLKENVECVQELPGLGIKAEIEHQQVMVGNAKMMQQFNIQGFEKEQTNGTVVYVALNQHFLGAIKVADTLKATAKTTIEQLHELGVNDIMMLTGDNLQVGKQIAHEVGIADVQADLMPQDKVKAIEDFRHNHPHTKSVFVGDGLNDTPSLAIADIGVAMGALGSDAAVEAADVVLIHDDPAVLPRLIKIARRTKMIVYQNITLALVMKILFLILAAFGFATMWEAVFADVGVTLIAVLNALKINRKNNQY